MSETPKFRNPYHAIEPLNEMEQADRTFMDLQEALAALSEYEQQISALENKTELTEADYLDLMRSLHTQQALENFVIGKYDESLLDRAVVLKLLEVSMNNLTTSRRWNEHAYAEATRTEDLDAQRRYEQAIKDLDTQIREKKVLHEWYSAKPM